MQFPNIASSIGKIWEQLGDAKSFKTSRSAAEDPEQVAAAFEEEKKGGQTASHRQVHQVRDTNTGQGAAAAQ